MKTIAKEFCISLLCAFLGYFGIKCLIDLMKVEEHKHYIFLLHPMSASNQSDHFTTAHVIYTI